MNLNEAAEIVRNHNPDATYSRCWNCERNFQPEKVIQAAKMLKQAALSELDPTPITEEWLAANPHIEKATNLLRVDTLTGQIAYSVKGFRVKTIGELRTLLRLCGETQGEAK